MGVHKFKMACRNDEMGKTTHNHQSTKCHTGTVSKSVRGHSVIKHEEGEQTVEFAKRHKTNKGIIEFQNAKLAMTHTTKNARN